MEIPMVLVVAGATASCVLFVVGVLLGAQPRDRRRTREDESDQGDASG